MELSWTTSDRARAMVKSKRDAGFTINAGFADEIAAAMDSEVEQRTKDLEDEKAKLVLQVGVYRAAYRARFAAQNHDSGCLHCQGHGSMRCEAGARLRNEAAKAEEKAGEMDSDITDKRKGETC